MHLAFDDGTLRQLVRPIAEEIAAVLGTVGDDDRLAYPEPEAAKLLGIATHQLRDARLRGEVTATKVGGRIGYEKTELLGYLARGRTNQ